MMSGMTTQPSDDDLTAARALRRATLRLGRRLQAERADDAMSLTKISVLGHLLRKGPMTAGALAAADRLQPQSLTRVLADLEQAGLIERLAATGDRRQRRFAITEAGQAAGAADMQGRDEWLAHAIGRGLSVVERDLVVLAASLIERLAETENYAGAEDSTTGRLSERNARPSSVTAADS
jgi:DNA-binding MarR family transcriptional regulator